jgi:transcriptional regulator with XRE-family HTH domain
MTQRDLSAALRKPPSFIAKVEGGERNLSVLELLRIAQALGISASSLLSEIESGMPQGFDI